MLVVLRPLTPQQEFAPTWVSDNHRAALLLAVTVIYMYNVGDN